MADSSVRISSFNKKIVIIGAIGDNSCFYHSLCQAVIPTYQKKEKIKKYAKNLGYDNVSSREARQIYVDNLRRSILSYMFEEVETENLKRKIKLANLASIIGKYFQKNETIRKFNNEEDAKNYFFGLLSGDIESDLNFQSIENYVIAIFLEQGKNVNPEKIKKYILKYLNYFFETKNLKSFLKKCNSDENTEEYFKNLRNEFIYFFDLIKNNYGNHEVYSEYTPSDLVGNIDEILSNSIWKESNELATNENIEDFFNRDPRDDFNIENSQERDFIYSLPLNSRIFTFFNFEMLDRVSSGSFSLLNLSKVVCPKISSGKTVSREDSGLSDIIGLIPEILKINVHILNPDFSKYISVPDFFKESNYPNVIIMGDGSHFECIGWVDEYKNIQTVFSAEDRIIKKLSIFE